MTTTRILVLDKTEALADQVRASMQDPPTDSSVETCATAEAAGELLGDSHFDVLVAGSTVANRAGLARLELVHEEYPGTGLVLAFANRPPATLRDIVRVGAWDMVQLPAEDKEIREAIIRAAELGSRTRPAVAPQAETVLLPAATDRPPGRVFTTSSATGGCGKTFLATNLAYFLARYTGMRTCVVDLDLQFGEVTTALRLRPRYTIFDALQREDTDDADLRAHIEEYVVPHETGFWVLAAPKEPSEADHIAATDVTRIIEAVRSRFDFVVVDTPAALTEVVLAAFDLSDVLYTMATLDLPSVRNMGVFLNQLDRLKIPADNIRLILNKAESGVGIDVEQVTRLFPKQFSAVLPYAREVTRSINLGMPVLASSPTAEVSRQLSSGLAEILPEEMRSQIPAAGRLKTSNSLFARLFKR